MSFDIFISMLGTWITYFFQVSLAYLIFRSICLVIGSPRQRLRIWGWFLFLAVARWIYIGIAPIWADNFISSASHAAPSEGRYNLYQSFSLDASWASHLSWLPRWVWPFYLTILVLLLLRMLLKSTRLGGLLRSGESPSAVLQLLFQRMCREMKLKRCRMLLIPELRSPATCGLWRATVLLPSSLISELKPTQLSHILRHELTHIDNRDYLWDRLAAVACRIVFFHPALWMAHRRLRWERELACDETVVKNNSEGRLQYAECLVKLARWSYLTNTTYADSVGFSSSASLLTTRVNAVLSEPRSYSAVQWASRAAIAVLLLAAGVIVLPFCGLTLSWRTPLLSSKAPSLTAHKETGRRHPNVTHLRQASQKTSKLAPQLASGSVNIENPAIDFVSAYGTPVMPILDIPSAEQGRSLGSAREPSGAKTRKEYSPWDESQAPGSGKTSVSWRKLAIQAATAAVAAIGGRDRSDHDDVRSHFR